MISGTFEANGRRWTFRKPYVGPVTRFNDVLQLAQEGKAGLAQIYRASLDVIHSAVVRLNPGVTVEELAEALDEDDTREFQSAVMRLSRPEEPASGESSRPEK